MEIIDINLINDKINLIIENHSFQESLRKIENFEKQRVFCLHDMQHFLDVARIMYIMSLEKDLKIPKYLIYATALLHDIGRGEQYENSTPHHKASLEIAKDVLQRCKYEAQEIDEILEAIGNHSNNTEKLNSLSHILYISDKLSRNCAKCKAIDNCKWPIEKRNLRITY